MTEQKIGHVEWCDLTVDNASDIKDFYCDVVGWKASGVSMGEYNDYNIMSPADGETRAGICHARGANANIPNQWLMYVRVADVNESVKACKEKGGKVLDGPRDLCGSNFCVIQDPQGAVLALMSEK